MFRLSAYEQLLRDLFTRHRLFPLRDWSGESSQPGIILRHDVDLEIPPAARIAELEKRVGVRSTFFLLLTAPTYNIFAEKNKRPLRDLVADGFELGVHFDLRAYGKLSKDEFAKALAEEKRLLELATGAKVESVSLHNPSLTGEFILFDHWRNAYDPMIFDADIYLSDSCMRFRHDPLVFFERATTRTMQFLTHPLHYTEGGERYPRQMVDYTRRSTVDLHQAFLENVTYRDEVGDRLFAALKTEIDGWGKL